MNSESNIPAGRFRRSVSADEIKASPAFATTRWTLVLAVGKGTAGEGHAALEQLCRAYWFPLYAYIRRRGHDAHSAQDLTQGFFARLLERNDLARTLPAKATEMNAKLTSYLTAVGAQLPTRK